MSRNDRSVLAGLLSIGKTKAAIRLTNMTDRSCIGAYRIRAGNLLWFSAAHSVVLLVRRERKDREIRGPREPVTPLAAFFGNRLPLMGPWASSWLFWEGFL